jgi:NAD(P)-dependent dehydrogenase (short-subunit alcohol dehydrogenase family)
MNGSDGLGIEASNTPRTYRYRPAMEAGGAAAAALSGRVALVAGGTRGAGRGIAIALGERGATVYVTGRSTAAGRSELGRSETIEGTAQLVDAAGGKGIAVRCDHSRIADVDALRARLEGDGGRLDVLVNDIWGGDALVRWGAPFWEHDLAAGLRAWRNAVETHLITSHRLAPLLVAGDSGLVIEVTDGDSDRYRGSLFYDLAKASAIRLAVAQASELAPHGVAAVSLTPGFLRSEAMLDHFGVDEGNWRDAVAQDPHFALSETPAYVGRAAAALAADPDAMRWNGQALSSWGLAREYGVRDGDGSQPDWGRWFDDVVLGGLDPATADPAGYR